MPDGSEVISLIDQLDAALKEAGIERSSFGEKYSVYSLRHFYAVNALRNGVGVFEVASDGKTGERHRSQSEASGGDSIDGAGQAPLLDSRAPGGVPR